MAEAAVELRAILDAAERAASAQDFASAEHYLRQAAAIQEAQLGPVHPELANTLNNLGIVFERVGKPADAEASYRRAYAIATATLAADDAIVLTSRQNLSDFCTATGKPFEVAPAASAPVAAPPIAAPPVAATPVTATPVTATPVTATPVTATPVTATPVAARPSSPSPSRPVPAAFVRATERAPVSRSAKSDTSRAVVVVGSSARAEPGSITAGRRYLPWIGLGIAVLAMLTWLALPSRTGDDRPAAPSSPTVAAPPAADGTALRAEPERSRDETTAPRREPSPAIVATDPTAAVVERPGLARETSVALVEAKLCQPLSLSDWQCTPATNPAESGGRVFFYTRLKTDRDTTVQHRWYVNGSLLQRVNLRIGANSGAGFRTYSRNTVTAERRGTWTIELRDASGALLHEERFVVQ
jgi:hypothetical protein